MNIKSLRLKYRKTINPDVLFGVSGDRSIKRKDRIGLIKDHFEENGIDLHYEDLKLFANYFLGAKGEVNLKEVVRKRIGTIKRKVEELKGIAGSQEDGYKWEVYIQDYESRIPQLEKLLASL